MDDAMIAVFDAKYAYGFWRPITAVRNAPLGMHETSWVTLIETPMHPEYPCAHCIVSAAVGAVLEVELAWATSPTLRSTSPTAVAGERTRSDPAGFVREVSGGRICAGVHYRNSTQVGQAMGRKISDGTTTLAPVGFFNSMGVARLAAGGIAYSACQPIHGDCDHPYVAVYGSQAGLPSMMGTLAVVPELDRPRITAQPVWSPNPASGAATLRFSLAHAGRVQLAVFALDGRRMATLADGVLDPGPHEIAWDGNDARGQRVRPGIYFARLRSADGVMTRALVQVR